MIRVSEISFLSSSYETFHIISTFLSIKALAAAFDDSPSKLIFKVF